MNHQIGDKGAFAVASLIEQSKRIVLVDISRNGLSPEGILRIAEAVSVNASLLSLECAYFLPSLIFPILV